MEKVTSVSGMLPKQTHGERTFDVVVRPLPTWPQDVPLEELMLNLKVSRSWLVKCMEDVEEKDSWQGEQHVQMPHIRDILLEEVKESHYDDSKKNVRTRGRQKPCHVIVQTMVNFLGFMMRTLDSERVLSKVGGGHSQILIFEIAL